MLIRIAKLALLDIDADGGGWQGIGLSTIISTIEDKVGTEVDLTEELADLPKSVGSGRPGRRSLSSTKSESKPG